MINRVMKGSATMMQSAGEWICIAALVAVVAACGSDSALASQGNGQRTLSSAQKHLLFQRWSIDARAVRGSASTRHCYVFVKLVKNNPNGLYRVASWDGTPAFGGDGRCYSGTRTSGIMLKLMGVRALPDYDYNGKLTATILKFDYDPYEYECNGHGTRCATMHRRDPGGVFDALLRVQLTDGGYVITSTGPDFYWRGGYPLATLMG